MTASPAFPIFRYPFTLPPVHVTSGPDNPIFKLWEVIDTLLGPGGCPWDKQQTPESLCDYILEEAHELVDAVRRGDREEARDELGDLPLSASVHGQTLPATRAPSPPEAVMESVIAKMIRRHPPCLRGAGHAGAGTTPAQLGADQTRGKRGRLKAGGLRQPARRPAAHAQGLPHPLQGGPNRLQLELGPGRRGAVGAGMGGMARGNALRGPGQDGGGGSGTACSPWWSWEGAKESRPTRPCTGPTSNSWTGSKRMETLARKRGLDLPTLSLEEQNALWEEVKAKR